MNHFYLTLLTSFILLSGITEGIAQTKAPHYLSFKSAKKLKQFFAFNPQKTIISGHRGTIEFGLPENAIASFEKVLAHTPAFFEIDPRLTKDSVIILMHDATLDRTTNGTGKVSDYTWAELQHLRLKDKNGQLTEHGIPTLEDVIIWAKGKTILNLDQKGVPPNMYLSLIEKYDATSFIMITVHSPEQAKVFLSRNKKLMLSAHIKTKEVFYKYQQSKVPFDSMIAYIGPDIKAENQQLYRLLNDKGVMCMISAAPSYDKLATIDKRAEAYRAIIADGASIIESDFPIEVSNALK